MPLYVDGTYDLDGDSLSELLLFYDEKDGGEIRYVEIEENGNHTLLWSFVATEDILGHISSVKMVDLENDNVPEIVAILRTEVRNKNNNTPWLLLFKWKGQTFSPLPMELYEDDLSIGRIRSSNFVVLNNNEMTTTIGAAFATPLRTGAIFNINMVGNEIQLMDFRLLESSVVGNGYGKVFIGSFEHKEKNKVVLFTLEANLIKISMYDMLDSSNPLQEIFSDVFSLNGAKKLFEPGIMTTDEDMNGNEELLLPFLNGEVATLSIEDGEMILKQSTFSKKPLFFLNKEANEKEINNFVLAKIEAGLYKSSLFPKPIEALTGEDRPDHFVSNLLETTEEVEDSLILGSDSLNLKTEVVSLDQKTPAAATATGEKPPAADDTVVEEQTGAVSLDQKTPAAATATGEKPPAADDTVVEEQTGAVSLDQKTPAAATATGEKPPAADDTVVEEQFLRSRSRKTSTPKEEGFAEQPLFPDYYSVSIAQKEEKGAVNFSSKGDTVFFVEVDTSLEKIVTHRISLDMGKMPVKTKANFEYKTERPVDAPVTQISLIHDLKTNMLLVSKSPVSSAIPQSFNPEAWDSQFHKYPEYLFDGFPATISMESFDAGIQFRIEEEVEIAKQTPFIEMVSPSDPSQKFKMYFKSGKVKSIKSVVKIRKSGSRKTVTRIDFIGEVNPIAVYVSLDELPIGATEKVRTSKEEEPTVGDTEKVRTPKEEDDSEVGEKLNDMGGQRIDK
jgi:hypothetical protein